MNCSCFHCFPGIIGVILFIYRICADSIRYIGYMNKKSFNMLRRPSSEKARRERLNRPLADLKVGHREVVGASSRTGREMYIKVHYSCYSVADPALLPLGQIPAG